MTLRSVCALLAAGAAGLLITLCAATDAEARGSNAASGVDRNRSSCPNEGWIQGNYKKGSMDPDKCYPKGPDSPRIYRAGSDIEKCIAGYDRQWGFCIEGFDSNWMANQKGNLDKADLADRCPAGWVTAPPLPGGKGRCRPEVSQPSAARLKGGGACKAGEIEEWGVWCTSKFEHLKAQRVKQAAAADWNDIYTATRGKEPRQSPDDNSSAVHKALLAKEGGPAPAAAADAGAAPAQASGYGQAAAVPAEAAAPVASSGCAAEAVGGALGQAAGGEAGAALGKMFGGLAAKVGKAGC